MRLNADFYRDWVEILKETLLDKNYDISDVPDDDLPFVYFNIEQRLIENRPRKIHLSDLFSCPSKLEKGWEIIKIKIELGQDIKPHLSKLVLKPTNKDSLLNDWKIHHFHLGEQLQGAFIARTGPLLFAIVTDDDFYVVNIFDHGNWTSDSIVEIIHKNWPDLISTYKIQDVKSLSSKITPQERLMLREAKINSYFECSDGTIYAPIGGGSTSSGYGTRIIQRVIKQKKNLEHLQKSLENLLPKIRNDLEKQGYKGEETLEVKLCIIGDSYKAFFPKYKLCATLKKL